MTEDHTTNEMHQALFASLVAMLSSSAMQQLGKLVNPMTQKTEVNLDGAQITIDMLAMLQAKTKGNLTDEEQKMIDDIVASLQMNYVETAKSAPPSTSGESDDTQQAEAEADSCDPQPETEATATEQDSDATADPGNTQEPKYHKSYGE